MKRHRLLSIVLFFFAAAAVRADDFASQVYLTPLRTLAVQDQQTIKTLDTYARQTLATITGSSTLDGHDALFSILDMAIRPESYRDRNLIKIRNVPLRQEFLRLNSLPAGEQERIVHDGTVSLNLWMADDVAQMLAEVQASDTRKSNAIDQASGAAALLNNLLRGGFPPVALIAPATAKPDQQNWHLLDDLSGTLPAWAADIRQAGHTPPPLLPDYDLPRLQPAVDSTVRLIAAWQQQDAAAVNAAAESMAQTLPLVNPQVYPSALQRNVEVIYNRLGKLTIPGAAFYFLAFVCFLMTSRSGVGSLRLWGLRFFFIGYFVHVLGIGVRWWLVGSIPIKNEFESVMFSSFFGATIGIILELRNGRGLFGAGASFVGWLSLIALFTVPYVFGRDIGGEIAQPNGVLMSYWLYIHVTMVTASYSMIGMGFLLSVWWLIRYYRDYDTLQKASGRQISGEARGFDAVMPGSGAATLGFFSTLARVAFVPKSVVAPIAKSKSAEIPRAEKSEAFLSTLDACNLVVLQLGFWILGVGIVCGAVWADQSWGRPWGWDPKETFALVTWIVYLIVVHVRVVTEDKAWWTAVLSVIGFFIMLFNWIGVNFFLVGLHSYA